MIYAHRTMTVDYQLASALAVPRPGADVEQAKKEFDEGIKLKDAQLAWSRR